MFACRFCGRSFETGQKLGGHAARCAFNPTREVTRAKATARQTGKQLSALTKANVARTIQQKIVDGTWHNSFARSRRHTYKGESFDGRWKVKLAMWFDENNVVWIRNRKNFPYVFDKLRRYTPDFFLPHIDCYIEVKGWKTPKDEAKWSQFTENLIVLSGSDLQSLGLDIEVRNDWKIIQG